MAVAVIPNHLRSYFHVSESKSFVLDLWKYIHISRLQSQHGIEDSFVDDIVPLTAAAILHLPEEEEEAPTVSEKVKVRQ